jgi:hypothetical protein
MKQNQVSSHTEYDRTPLIFRTVATLYPPPGPTPKILSFGCSTGEEVRTLSEKYLPNCTIHGIDINPEIIAGNRKSNANPLISYFSDMSQLDSDYDVIFCMSVLCRWPDDQKSYDFGLFEETLLSIDAHLKLGGHLVIYNGQYLLEETILKHRYIPLRTESINSGFVTKWHRNWTRVDNDHHPVIFRKTRAQNRTREKFGVIWANTINLGDDIQTLAAINFLEKKGVNDFVLLNRENISNYDGGPLRVLMSGWFMHDISKFPPPDVIDPLFISFHCENERLIAANASYFKRHEPIGCRDLATVGLFRKHGVEAYFTGCLTLYFDAIYRKSDRTYVVDVNECSYIPKVDVDLSSLANFTKLNHDLGASDDRNDVKRRLARAKGLLEQYSTARLVITSRLHCALPCRAYRTRVKFVHSNLRDPRFSGYEKILAGSADLEGAQETISEECLRDIVNNFDRITIS